MNMINATLHGITTRITRRDAVDLVAQLSAQLAVPCEHDYDPPVLSRGGYLTYEGVDQFFEQIYPARSMRINRITRLFSCIVNSASKQPGKPFVPFKIKCGMCNRQVNKLCGLHGGNVHMFDSKVTYMVNPQSLIVHASQFLENTKIPRIGPTVREDFSMIVSYLRDVGP